MSALSPDEVQLWLEWASARLLALPSEKIKPADLRVIWPEYAQNKWEVLDFRTQRALRALAPSSEEIPMMDEIMLLPNLLPDEQMRRAVRFRSLIDPINSRHLYTWPALAEKIGVTRQYTAKALYGRGLDKLSRLINPAQAARIGIFMSERAA